MSVVRCDFIVVFKRYIDVLSVVVAGTLSPQVLQECLVSMGRQTYPFSHIIISLGKVQV